MVQTKYTSTHDIVSLKYFILLSSNHSCRFKPLLNSLHSSLTSRDCFSILIIPEVWLWWGITQFLYMAQLTSMMSS